MILRTFLLILCFSLFNTVKAQGFEITFKQRDQIDLILWGGFI